MGSKPQHDLWVEFDEEASGGKYPEVLVEDSGGVRTWILLGNVKGLISTWFPVSMPGLNRFRACQKSMDK